LKSEKIPSVSRREMFAFQLALVYTYRRTGTKDAHEKRKRENDRHNTVVHVDLYKKKTRTKEKYCVSFASDRNEKKKNKKQTTTFPGRVRFVSPFADCPPRVCYA